MSETLEDQIKKLSAVEAIRTLMAKYCHGIDKKDETTFLSIWAQEASYHLPRGNASGIEEIRNLVHKVWKQVPKCHHHITNPIIEVHSETATAKTDVIYYRQTEDWEIQLLSGSYEFKFIDTSDGWKTSYLEFKSFETISPIFENNISL